MIRKLYMVPLLLVAPYIKTMQSPAQQAIVQQTATAQALFGINSYNITLDYAGRGDGGSFIYEGTPVGRIGNPSSTSYGSSFSNQRNDLQANIKFNTSRQVHGTPQVTVTTTSSHMNQFQRVLTDRQQTLIGHQILMANDHFATPEKLIDDHKSMCQLYAEDGERFLKQAKATHDHTKLERIMSDTSKSLRAAENDIKVFNSRNLFFDERYELQNNATENLYKAREIAQKRWEAAAKREASDWIADFDKKVAKKESFDTKLNKCFKKAAGEQDLFKQEVYKNQLDRVQEYELREFKRRIGGLPVEKLQQANAASCDNLATHLKNAENYKAAIPRAHPGCTFPKVHLKKEEFYADLERGKQKILSDLIAKKTPANKAVEQVGSAGTSAATKAATDGLSDRAKNYAQTNHISDETAYHLGNTAIDDLAKVAHEASNYPDLAALKKDWETSSINPLDIVTTGQPGMGEEGRYDTGLRDGALDMGRTLVGGTENGLKQFGDYMQSAGNVVIRGTGKGIDQFSTMNKDAMFFVMDFLDHPGQVSRNAADTIVSGADHFASQFKGDYVRLNEMLANEPQNVKDYYHNLVTVLEKGSMGSMSSKTIETIAGTKLCIDRIPGNVCKHFMGLSAEDKIACVTSGGLNLLLPSAVVAQAGEAIQTAKLTAAVTGNALKEGTLAATSKVAETVGRAGEAVNTVIQGAKTGETVAIAGIGGMKVPANVMSEAEKIAATKIKAEIVTSGEACAHNGLPNSMFRQGEASGAGAAQEVIRVNNMKEFFSQYNFGKTLEPFLEKTKKLYDGQAIYRVRETVNGDLKKGYYVYLDGLHKDHLEVFGNNGAFKTILNLDGTENFAKVAIAFRQGRTIKNLI